MPFLVKNNSEDKIYPIDFNKLMVIYLFGVTLMCASAQVFAKNNENLTTLNQDKLEKAVIDKQLLIQTSSMTGLNILYVVTGVY